MNTFSLNREQIQFITEIAGFLASYAKGTELQTRLMSNGDWYDLDSHDEGFTFEEGREYRKKPKHEEMYRITKGRCVYHQDDPNAIVDPDSVERFVKDLTWSDDNETNK